MRRLGGKGKTSFRAVRPGCSPDLHERNDTDFGGFGEWEIEFIQAGASTYIPYAARGGDVILLDAFPTCS